MKPNSETLLTKAIEGLLATAPGPEQISASARRVAVNLGIESPVERKVDSIQSCDDVQQLLPAYRRGTLASARSLMVRAHLRDCGVCHLHLSGGAANAAVEWSRPVPQRSAAWHPRAYGWALAAGLALAVASGFLYRAYWRVPPGVRAEVQSIDGALYHISDDGNASLSAGDKLSDGEVVRTSGGAHAVLRLEDGSTIEMNERTVLAVGERGRNTNVSLDDGAVVVSAAKRTSGHLFLKTPDCRVAVTGTVFSVNAGIKGSRVSVLQGTVHVEHAGMDSLLHVGDQIATSDTLTAEPVDEQISWSQDRDKYLLLLAQFSSLQHKLDQLPLPQLRYTSDLLDRAPADTLLYISIPNLGDFLSQAHSVFQDQLKQSPALQEWWEQGRDHNTADLDGLVDKLHQVSQYLGDEIVFIGLQEQDTHGFAVVADIQKSGLDAFLKEQFPAGGSVHGLTVLDERSLETASIPASRQVGGYALVRPREVVFSDSLATLKQMNKQLNGGTSGFASQGFGQQIKAAYERGAGMILAADLHQMLTDRNGRLHGAQQKFGDSGMHGVQYLIAEHREQNGLPENHLNLQFAGTRQRVASWLAAPAPMGSLEFVTPNASVVVAALSKDPKEIADDIMTMASSSDGSSNEGLENAEQQLHINIREDLAANLGGEFLFAFDGPVLPTPAWKAVIEVRDSEKLEKTLEQLVAAIRHQDEDKSHPIEIGSSQVGGQRLYSIRDLATGSTFAEYMFADGYMIIAPNRALLMEALKAYSSGNSLARSSSFKSLLPDDRNDNYSAVAYQNAGPVLTPLLSHIHGQTADALRQVAADARPTAVFAWGQDSRIEAASNSRLFGFDFLTLAALLQPGNHSPAHSVKD